MSRPRRYPLARSCQGCGVAIQSAPTGPPRKWCSARCRRLTLYSRPCLDCGAALGGSKGHSEKAPVRCQKCASAHSGRALKVWTREVVTLAIQEWAQEHGGAGPTSDDWNRSRAELGERWPHKSTVYREFGSWPAALAAAAVPPRRRRRSARPRAAPRPRHVPAASSVAPSVPTDAVPAPSRRRQEPDEVAEMRATQARLKAQAMARWAAA
jgi:hypothetical protein